MSQVNPNDYIFRERLDGSLELIGDFEGMYREDDDPWNQAARPGLDLPRQRYYTQSRANLIKILRGRLTPYPARTRLGLEVGCGHGHVTKLLQDTLWMNWDGMDVSKTAVDRASKLYP